jgi:cytoplasmic iron level regulating protein YaaA (DUF328/UPF0246 family)
MDLKLAESSCSNMISHQERCIIITNESTIKNSKDDSLERPALYMFSATFREIRTFSRKLNGVISNDIFIISNKYGLIHQSKKINKYSNKIKNIKELQELDEKLLLSKALLEKAQNYKYIILVLPSFFINYLISQEWFKELKPEQIIIIISGKTLELKDKIPNRLMILQRKGMARIGINNQIQILNFISVFLKKKIIK